MFTVFVILLKGGKTTDNSVGLHYIHYNITILTVFKVKPAGLF